MTELPNDTINVYLAVRRPCELCGGSGHGLWQTCPVCHGKGTRKVHTEIEMERDNRLIYGEDSVRWREVPRG